MNVRLYKPEDAAPIARLFTESVHASAASHYSREQISAWVPVPPDVEHWRNRLNKLFCLVAEIDSDMIGFATLKSAGHLEHLCVLSQFQRRRVATALYLLLEQEAISRGAKRITTEASITARPFFERSGFRVTAIQEVERRGISLANYRMERFLSKISSRF